MCRFCEDPNGRYWAVGTFPFDDLHSDMLGQTFTNLHGWMDAVYGAFAVIISHLFVFLIHYAGKMGKNQHKGLMESLASIIDHLSPGADLADNIDARVEQAFALWEGFKKDGLGSDKVFRKDLQIFLVRASDVFHAVDLDSLDLSLYFDVARMYTLMHMIVKEETSGVEAEESVLETVYEYWDEYSQMPPHMQKVVDLMQEACER